MYLYTILHQKIRLKPDFSDVFLLIMTYAVRGNISLAEGTDRSGRGDTASALFLICFICIICIIIYYLL